MTSNKCLTNVMKYQHWNNLPFHGNEPVNSDNHLMSYCLDTNEKKKKCNLKVKKVPIHCLEALPIQIFGLLL